MADSARPVGLNGETQISNNINSDLCADSILNRVVEHARFLDIKGPNMREYTARLKAEREKGYWD